MVVLICINLAQSPARNIMLHNSKGLLIHLKPKIENKYQNSNTLWRCPSNHSKFENHMLGHNSRKVIRIFAIKQSWSHQIFIKWWKIRYKVLNQADGLCAWRVWFCDIALNMKKNTCKVQNWAVLFSWRSELLMAGF